ncbi:hypothetical protein FZEAL_8975 [Fusarium zealandicum]|uniref:Zn(2)-C6 fungal-type domain-containing protein n=1 Tax=Fusarium zealandicum TaxID=1053134 RepID=A0A8H4UDS4_9HYPO|nr:hypothetical protein FZEAL_8975 [Fusarium zealandicum]
MSGPPLPSPRGGWQLAGAELSSIDSSTADNQADSAVSEPGSKRRRTDKSRTTAAYPRKRAVSACQLCRARKIKCNNSRPSCGSCQASKARCVYEDSQDHSAFDPASILILERLNDVLSQLENVRAKGDDLSPSFQGTRGAPSVDEQDSVYAQLRIPPAKTSPDGILQWPIFENQYPPNYLNDAVFAAEASDDDCDLEHAAPGLASTQDKPRGRARTGFVDEDAVVEHVQQFLDLVHTKNPILDVETVCLYAQTVAEDGLRWDSVSCLVLLACSLGCVAQPFSDVTVQPASLETYGDILKQGDAYFNLAQRRLGLLGHGILASQCHFLAGVYLMYTLRPLRACRVKSILKRLPGAVALSRGCTGAATSPSASSAPK